MTHPVLLLHGFTGTGGDFDPIREAFAGREVMAPDLPGHGNAAERPATFEDTRAWLGGLASVTSGPWEVIGYSMGARLALDLAVHAPEGIARLVLIGGTPGLADPAERAARRAADEALADRIERLGTETFLAEWLAQPMFAHLRERCEPHRWHTMMTRRRAVAPRGLANALRGLGTGVMEPLWDALPRVTVPTHLVVGAEDTKFLAIAHEMQARMPVARLSIIPGAGHAAHLERPQAVIEALLLR